jgi:hypothetical protein
MSPFTSACIEDHFTGSIRSTISRRSRSGFWISALAFLKISPSIPGCSPSSSRQWR